MQVTSSPRPGLFGRLGRALSRTREAFSGRLAALFGAGQPLDEQAIESLESLLLSADIGVDASNRIVDAVRRRARRGADGAALLEAVRETISEILAPVEIPLAVPAGRQRPWVILVVGVNGAGKTTTIGKLAHRLTASGHRVMLAAGDTFRAAAIEQLQAWGERAGVPVIAQHPGADSASVVYDALESATARGCDVLLADTAGRLHTQDGLMAELAKVRRVMGKIDPEAPHETLLVVDAGTGQNAIAQARSFGTGVGVTGLVLTKLDGTAKGGVVVAIAEQLRLPIRMIGVGEDIESLRDFVAAEFLDALLSA